MAGTQQLRKIEPGIRECKNPSGLVTYIARVMVGSKEGNRKGKSATFNTLADARIWYRAQKGQAAVEAATRTGDSIGVAMRKPEVAAVLGERTVANLLEWYRLKGTSEKAATTQNSENRLINKLLRHPIASMRVADVRGTDVYNMLADMKAGKVPPPPRNDGYFRNKHGGPSKPPPPTKPISDTSAYRFFTLLNVAFNRGIEESEPYIPDRNPCSEIRKQTLTGPKGLLPKWKSQHRDRRLHTGEGKRLIAALKQGPNALEMEFLVRLSLIVPTRRGEWLGATWGQIDLTRRRFKTKRRGHGEDKQTIPLIRRARVVLAAMLVARGSPPLPDEPLISRAKPVTGAYGLGKCLQASRDT